MNRGITLSAIAAAATILAACGGGNPSTATTAAAKATTDGARAKGNLTTISVLGNRADLVSGGQALIEVTLPEMAKSGYADVKVMLNGSDVTSAFSLRTNGRYMGLVQGLADGSNSLVAQVPNGPGARLTITNHAIGGPVFSGPQVMPWECATKVTNPSLTNPDLGDPLDEQCNVAAPVYRYQYMNATSGRFSAYDPANPPAKEAIATTTTDDGHTVPYIVRIERGVINRGKYDVAYLANPEDPTRAWSPWERSASWNGKLYWPFGSGCGFIRQQRNPGNVMIDTALKRGYMVASSEMTNYGSHCNDVTSSETVMMVKEHISEQYGEIRFTFGQGDSGGAHQQHLTASNYPGLLQGLLPGAGWQDTWTTGREFADCGLLKRYYDGGGSGLNYTVMDRAHVAGHRYDQVCEGPANTNMASRTPFYMDATQGCNDADGWSLANPGGIRCTLQDFNIAVFGPRDATGYARTPHDNVGIQYGFDAVNAGQISVEQFLRLNELVGGYDINGQWQPQRMQADPGAVHITHASGRVPHGRGLGEVAILADVQFNIIEEHYDFRTWVIRNRILSVHGDHDTHVLWRRKGNPPDYLERRFATMDAWLTNVEADTSNRSHRAKLAAAKPSFAVDSCWRADAGWSTDATACNTAATPHSNSSVTGSGADALYTPTDDEWPVWRDTRVASGEPLTSDIMKCQLKTPARSDYAELFTAGQWARLLGAFPQGVCDYSVPGVDQVEPHPWQTFMSGPGGQPLPPAPRSKPGDGAGVI